MKRITILLWMLATLVAQSASVTLAWDPNTEPDVAGYRLYYGINGFGTVVNCGNVTNQSVLDLQPGRMYSFYVTCYNTSGLESEPSNVVEYVVPGGPERPTTLRPKAMVKNDQPAGGGVGVVESVPKAFFAWSTISLSQTPSPPYTAAPTPALKLSPTASSP